MLPIDTLGRNIPLLVVVAVLSRHCQDNQLTAGECVCEKVISELDEISLGRLYQLFMNIFSFSTHFQFIFF